MADKTTTQTLARLTPDRRSAQAQLYATLLTQAPQTPPPAQRLLVLVPDEPVAEAVLARTIWELAQPRQTPVVFVTLVKNEAGLWRARRRLATLAALARDMHNTVDTRLMQGEWLRAVQSLWVPGDLIVCHAEQTTPGWGRLHSLVDLFIARRHWPVYVLSGFYPTQTPAAADWTRAVLFDVTAAVTVIVFLLFQLELQPLEPPWLHQLLLAFSVLVEFGALMFWHAYFLKDSSHD